MSHPMLDSIRDVLVSHGYDPTKATNVRLEPDHWVEVVMDVSNTDDTLPRFGRLSFRLRRPQ